MRSTRLVMAVSALAIAFTAPARSGAQTNVKEFWPEVDFYYRVAEHQRTFVEVSGSAEQEGTKREGTVGLYQDYLQLPEMFLRGGVRITSSMHDASYREIRLVGETTNRVYSSGRVRLLNRTRGELRWVNSEYSWRIRDRLHLQREAKYPARPAWAPYVTFEAYYDSRYNTISRLGGRGGTEARLSKMAVVDVYIAHVDNSRGEPDIVNSLGITLKLSLK